MKACECVLSHASHYRTRSCCWEPWMRLLPALASRPEAWFLHAHCVTRRTLHLVSQDDGHQMGKDWQATAWPHGEHD